MPRVCHTICMIFKWGMLTSRDKLITWGSPHSCTFTSTKCGLKCQSWVLVQCTLTGKGGVLWGITSKSLGKNWHVHKLMCVSHKGQASMSWEGTCWRRACVVRRKLGCHAQRDTTWWRHWWHLSRVSVWTCVATIYCDRRFECECFTSWPIFFHLGIMASQF